MTDSTQLEQRQYLRKLSCVIGADDGAGLDFSPFRVTFMVQRGDKQTPNTCDIRVYNLSQGTMNRVQEEFTQVALQAGYENGNFGLIFRGTVKQVRKGRENQTDTYLDITAADGDEAYNFATIVGSLAAGATPADQVQVFLKGMGPFGVTQNAQLPTFSGNGSIRGRVFCGMASDVVRRFAKNQQVNWFIEDGQLTMIPLGGYLPGPIPTITPRSGLIGIPEQTLEGINIRCLLNPTLKIGRLIRLQATVNQARMNLTNDKGGDGARQNYNLAHGAKLAGAPGGDGSGLYYVMQANHHGDTRGNDWYTDLICLAMDATQVPENFIDTAKVPGESVIPRSGVIDWRG